MAVPPIVPPSDVRGYSFGPFLVDTVRRLLWRDGHVVPLSSKTFDLLTILLQNRRKIVDKEHLLRLIWPDAVVQENNLVRQVSTLRKALGQRLDQHDYIVTISGQGYRFVGEVAELAELPKDLPCSADPASVAAQDEPGPILAAATPGEPGADTTGTLVSPPLVGRPGGVHRILPFAILAAGIVIAVAVITGRQSQAQAPQRSLRQFTYEAGLQQSPAWSPDGQSIAYASNRTGNSEIWVQTLRDPTPTRITTSAAADWQPAWSPDGRWIAFRSERDGGGLYVVPVGGGQERRIADMGFQPAWSPDSRRVLFTSAAIEGLGRTAYVVGLDRGAVEAARPDLSKGMRSVSVAWHPDGRVSLLGRERAGLRFLTAAVGPGAPVVSEIPAALIEQIARLRVGRFVWSPKGTSLLLEGELDGVRNLWRVTLDSKTLAWSKIDRLTSGIGHDTDVALSPDGKRAAFTVLTERTRLWSFPFDQDTGHVSEPGEPVTPGASGEFDAAAPPDGSKLAYRTERAGRQELWEHSIESGEDRLLLASSDWRMTSPRWSRDGTRLAYQRGRTGDAGAHADLAVAILPSNGGAEALLSMPGKMSVVPDDWSPDGASILGACRDGSTGRMGTCVMAASATSGVAQVKSLASDPAKDLICQRFSPNQRWISFMAVGPERNLSTLYVMPASGGPWTQMTEGTAYDDKPRWSPDGRTLYFISNRNGLLNLWARRFDPDSGTPVGAPFRATSFENLQQRLTPDLHRMEIAVSARRIFMPITETSGKIWILDQIDK